MLKLTTENRTPSGKHYITSINPRRWSNIAIAWGLLYFARGVPTK